MIIYKMDILIICVSPNALTSPDNSLINNLSTIYAYHFNIFLKQYKGNTITFKDYYMTVDDANTLNKYDFCIITMNRGVVNMNKDVYKILRDKIKYHIITICEYSNIIGEEDLLIFMMGKQKSKTMRLYWGANNMILKPSKSNDVINILVDHQYYGKTNSPIFELDKTSLLLNSLLEYQKKNKKIIIEHITNGKVQLVTDNYKIETFRRSDSLDFREIYKYYNKIHIFVVTHPESMGLSTIECGCSGTLIVFPERYIRKEISEKLHHYEIKNLDSIDWDSIINTINIPKSVEMAQVFSYKNTINALQNYMVKVKTSPNI